MPLINHLPIPFMDAGRIVDVLEVEWQRDFIPVPWATWSAHDMWTHWSKPTKGAPWRSFRAP